MHGSEFHRELHRQYMLAVEVVPHSCVIRTIPEVVAVASPLPPFNPYIVDLSTFGLGSHIEAIGVLRHLA